MTGRYWIETWGCQMNVHDSEKLAGALRGLGYRRAESMECADLILFNTCAVRAKAAEKPFTLLGRLRQLKETRPETILGLCGCVAQTEGDRAFQRAHHLDLVFGPRAVGRLPELLHRVRAERRVRDTTHHEDSVCFPWKDIHREPGCGKAYVTIIEGCNRACSYCVVPFARGAEVSRPLQDVLEETRSLVAGGVREVEYLGQNVSAYRDPGGHTLVDLLRAADRIPGLLRLRFTTSHPMHLGEGTMEAMATLPRVCDHLHLPFQSGSDRVLQRMRRGYTIGQYRKKVHRLRSLVPGLSLSADVIVGFPGETSDDFRQTLDLVREVEFDQLYSFAYSPRPHTAAGEWPDDVPRDLKHQRLIELQEVQAGIQRRRNERWIGRDVEILVEGRSRRHPDEWAGRTTWNRVVNLRAPGARAGAPLQVRIIDAGAHHLKGMVQPETASS
jgi:tRNA-2-methylthio-N6-dimethylallyladenosine synthase